jgi:4-amino-4-deoxy-L-arabinose transferase-like glycosyltransferase/putative flippase GtrA
MSLVTSRFSPLLRHASLKFASVGMLNTLLTLVIIFSLKSFFGVADSVANLSGYLVGLALSFALNKRWTFEHKAAHLPALGRFLSVFAVAYAVNLGAVITLIHLGANHYFAHMAGMPLYTVVFYFGCRDFAFATDHGTDQAGAQARIFVNYRKWYLATLLLLASVMLYRLGVVPVEVWDEARLANNAVEMARSGLSLVTTYGGVPDHWNTKPPLLIWLMSLSIRMLGVNEWALRLPSALAAIATGSIVFWFCAVRLGRPFAGFAANLLLLATPGYVISHGARSGDYDSMLTLWTTAYLFAGYLYIHARRERQGIWLAVFSACAVLAFLTKTIQGLVFLPALVLYACVQGRALSILRTRSFYVGMALVLLACVGYYFLREQVDPGYFAAARINDLGGRYGTVIEQHQGGHAWYVRQFSLFPWILPGLLSGAAVFWRSSGEPRKVSLYVGLATVFYLAVISSASTKLSWYAIPLCPLLALLMGMALDGSCAALRERLRVSQTNWSRILAAGCVVFGVGVVAINAVKIERHWRRMSVDEFDRYDVFLRSNLIPSVPKRNLVIVHPGYPNSQGDRFYVAPTLFYAAALRANGDAVTVQPVTDEIQSDADTLVVCGEALLKQVATSVTLQVIATSAKCGLYQITGNRQRPAGLKGTIPNALQATVPPQLEARDRSGTN